MCCDGVADHLDDARHQLNFRDVTIGKARVVGEIDVARVGARPHDLAEHGEAAEAGIQQQDGREIRHVAR